MQNKKSIVRKKTIVRISNSVLPYLTAKACNPVQNATAWAIASVPACTTVFITFDGPVVCVGGADVITGALGAVAGAAAAVGAEAVVLGVGADVAMASSKALLTTSTNDIVLLCDGSVDLIK